jgi:hypothetical protein
MPVVLRRGGFRVRILFPPREHPPPHVHVRNSNGSVVIELETRGTRQRIRESRGMSARDIAAAFRLVEEHSDFLLRYWRKHHG